MSEGLQRIAGNGWLALLGGGEFSFGETEAADRAWLAKVDAAPPMLAAGAGEEGEEAARELRPIGFIPAASGSEDYGEHFLTYLDEEFDRPLEVIPVYRSRDARRRRNCERIEEMTAVYLGGGVTDQLLEALAGSAAEEALRLRLQEGGVVVAIAAAAQALGEWARSLYRGDHVPGLGWLPEGVVEPNFDPGHARRLRRLLSRPHVSWGLGLPAGSAVLLGPGGAVETVGPAYLLRHPEGELEIVEPRP